MLLAVLYTVVCLFTDLAQFPLRSRAARDVELLASRHEVRVVRHHSKRACWRPRDRFLFAVLGRCLPRGQWPLFPVRPKTHLCWHRALVGRTWAAIGRQRGPGRPPLPAEGRDLVVRLGRENPRPRHQLAVALKTNLRPRWRRDKILSVLARRLQDDSRRHLVLASPGHVRPLASAGLEAPLAVEVSLRRPPAGAPSPRSPPPGAGSPY